LVEKERKALGTVPLGEDILGDKNPSPRNVAEIPKMGRYIFEGMEKR
jgi:hypothetical protein